MTMYNKLFTKILDSSIWLEPTPTRIVWLTFIAVMDEDGFVQFASVANVAHRARVTLEEADEAIRILENPDQNSSDPDNEGCRIERVPGGWMVLNAAKHREMVTRVVIKEQTRKRVKRFREKKNGGSNASVTQGNENVTTSDTDTDSKAVKRKRAKKQPSFIPPSKEEVIQYFADKGYSSAAASKAFDGYDVADWHDTKGNKIRNWKQKMINVWFTEENKTKRETTTGAYKPHPSLQS